MPGVGSSPAPATCGKAKFCLRVCQVVFLEVPSLIGQSLMSSNNLERAVKLNLKKKYGVESRVKKSGPSSGVVSVDARSSQRNVP